MSKLRFSTSGESHGKALAGVIEGIPANLALSSAEIDADLRRRQSGHGRGGRMKIETDHAEIISGVRWGKTLGSPIALMIENRDHRNWVDGMSADASGEGSLPPVTRPRPGHADLPGAVKYDQHDARNILERSSARETAARVALGAVAKRFLSEFGVRIGSYVVSLGGHSSAIRGVTMSEAELFEAHSRAEASPVRCPSEGDGAKMIALIDQAMQEGNTLGGVFEVFVGGLPVGLGSHVQWDRKLDGLLAQALMSIQAIKGVEVGLGFGAAALHGSEVMDEITFSEGAFSRNTNRAGGIEGGMSNGMPILVRAAMKPIPTLRRPLRSVDMVTKEGFDAAYERSDVCAVPAASVVAEAMTALAVAGAFLEKFGGDSVAEVSRNFHGYLDYLKTF